MRALASSCLLVAVCCSCLAATGYTAEAPAQATAMADKLLAAIQHDDYDSFVGDGTPAVKSVMTKQMLQGVSAQFAPRMAGGYEKIYLGELNQQGCQVYLWKLSYKGGGDDTLVKLVLKDGKVAGFWLQ